MSHATHRWMMALLLYLACTQMGFAQQASPQQADSALQSITFRDLDGNEHSIPNGAPDRYTVLVFINTTCPIANAYHPTLSRLRSEFVQSKFDFVLVHSDPDVSIEAARKHQQEYQITWSIALDPGNRIARRVKAKVTPEAIVIDSKGEVRYRGRIDDRHQDYGRKRPAPTTNDLHDALVAIRDGQAIAVPETKAIGCVIHLPSAEDAQSP